MGTQITNKMKTKICIEFTLAIFALIFVSWGAAASADSGTTKGSVTIPSGGSTGGNTGGNTGGTAGTFGSGLTSPPASGSGSEGLSSTPDFIYVLMSAAAAFISRQI